MHILELGVRHKQIKRGATLLVPVLFALIQGREHDGHNGAHIVTDQTQDVLIIPKIQ